MSRVLKSASLRCAAPRRTTPRAYGACRQAPRYSAFSCRCSKLGDLQLRVLPGGLRASAQRVSWSCACSRAADGGGEQPAPRRYRPRNEVCLRGPVHQAAGEPMLQGCVLPASSLHCPRWCTQAEMKNPEDD
eukprot:250502-Chlamydomonas_euryale.AAC.13